MNSKNSKMTDPHRLLLNIADKIDLRKKYKYIALSNLSIYYNKKMSYISNKFKISAPTWNEQFELPDRLYFISDIQDYFRYILKKYGEKTGNPSKRIYINKIENRITFNIKIGYYLELLIPETIKLVGSTKGKMKMVEMFLILK